MCFFSAGSIGIRNRWTEHERHGQEHNPRSRQSRQSSPSRERTPSAAESRGPARPQTPTTPRLLSGGNPPDSRRLTAILPFKPTSRRCRAGNATSGVASTRSSPARFPGVGHARPSNGTRLCTESRMRGRAGSSASIASRSTSKWPSSAVHRCACPARRIQAEGSALPRHPRGWGGDDPLDEAQLADWVKQASRLPRRTDVIPPPGHAGHRGVFRHPGLPPATVAASSSWTPPSIR